MEAEEDSHTVEIQEIKVKWNSFIKMKRRDYLEDYTIIK